MSRHQHRCHGDDSRFEVVADFVGQRWGNRIHYIADIAGGQGLLSRLLHKRFNYEAEVIDPRGWVLKGVPNRAEEFDPALAAYYDLIIGLHPDQAIRAVAEAALVRPALLVPCCNFWSEEEKLGRDALLVAIEAYYRSHSVQFERVALNFKGPYNYGLVSEPSK
jgi:hypothetical protein